MILSLAKSGLFNLPEFTPMESAQKANLYQALHFLSAESELAKEERDNNQT